MMGMVFTELLDMIEQTHSLDVVDAVLERAGLAGAYTSVGNYDDAELGALVAALHAETGAPVDDLLEAFGHHVFHAFVRAHGAYFAPHDTAVSFLRVLESHVHVEVRKLYPDARPPLFEVTHDEPAKFILDYRSDRGLYVFASGLIAACLTHFGNAHRMTAMTDLSEGQGTHVSFVLEPA